MERANHILVLAPHPDDAELGVGASMAKWVGMGAEVTILMLSDRGEPQWMSEASKAAQILHENIHVETLHQTVFHFSQERQAILRAFESYRDKLKPDLVFAPAAGDAHQDHEVAMREARRVFRGGSLFGYEIIRSNMSFRPQVFVPVTQVQIERKICAVACYASQCDKLYIRAEAIAGLAAVRGAQCESPTGLAEAFEIEWAVLE